MMKEDLELEDVPLTDEESEWVVGYGPNGTVTSQIPSRLDRLPFSRYHLFIVLTLGITWMLDGLETTMVGVVSALLKREDTMGFSNIEIGITGTVYLFGSVTGALIFGYLADRYGRKKLYIVTPAVYLVATALTAFSGNFLTFAFLRFITGAGLGGEYSAMGSAIDELIPARVRGTVDLIINGSYWLGAILSSALSLLILNPNLIHSANLSWRLMFLLGAFIGIIIIVLRLFLPESPRWLLTHGYPVEAERIVRDIEERICKSRQIKLTDLPAPLGRITFRQGTQMGFIKIAKSLIFSFPRRTFLALTLMVAQAFFYNAIGFTYALILTDFYGVSASNVGVFLLPFAIGNFLGPLLLGRLFDVVGRRIMISATYTISGLLLIISGILFWQNLLNSIGQAVFWGVIFFVASPAASSAYLTVSEIFPLEIRALSIAFFYSVGTAVGGLGAPSFFGVLLESGQRGNVMLGYLFGGLLMLFAALVEIWLGPKAERQPLESIATPLTVVMKTEETTQESM